MRAMGRRCLASDVTCETFGMGSISACCCLCTHILDSFCSQSVTLMINSSGTSWSGGAAAGSSGCMSADTSLNTILMLLARASVSPSHSCSTRSHKCDLDGCSPIIVLIVFHHCLELLSPILSRLCTGRMMLTVAIAGDLSCCAVVCTSLCSLRVELSGGLVPVFGT